jgi:hypothetical protein
VVAGNSKRKMNLRTTGPPCLGAVFVLGPLPSFFQLSSLAIRRLRKACARGEGQISFWMVGVGDLYFNGDRAYVRLVAARPRVSSVAHCA